MTLNPPSQDVKDILVAEGSALGLVFASNLFVSQIPETPDACVAVFDTGGYAPECDYQYERPTVQVRVRGAKGAYRDAHLLAQAIRNSLHGSHGEIVNGARYIGIWCEGDVIALGLDGNGRPMLSLNVRIHRTASA